jgi:hypothetical protein
MKKLLLIIGFFVFINAYWTHEDSSVVGNLSKVNSLLNSGGVPPNAGKTNPEVLTPRTAPVLVPLPNQTGTGSNNSSSNTEDLNTQSITKPKDQTSQTTSNTSSNTSPPASSTTQPTTSQPSTCVPDDIHTCTPTTDPTTPPACDPGTRQTDSTQTTDGTQQGC